ncbi:MAG TPA: YihY family inner membrane protein, partial [Burkholderiales bacterium]|nr:YihY family inner membrane protein [Burkholderiales bacterium]
LVPASASKVLGVYVEQFAENAGRLTTLGLVLLSVAAIMMMHTIERTFDRIWRVRRPRPLIARMLTYWAVVTVGPLLLGASLSLTSWLVTQSIGALGQERGVGRALLRVLPWALTCLALAFLYRTVPNRRVLASDAILGGLLSGTLFEAMKWLFGVYVKQVPTFKLIYGTFASFPIFLTWIYLSWLVVLIGAELTAALPYLRAGGLRARKWPGSLFLDAVRLLKLLHEEHQAGRALTAVQLRQALRISIEECEFLLDRLRQLGWAAPTSAERWVLAKDLGQLRLAEVYAEFVFNPIDEEHAARTSFEHRVIECVSGATKQLSTSLKAIIDPDDVTQAKTAATQQEVMVAELHDRDADEAAR